MTATKVLTRGLVAFASLALVAFDARAEDWTPGDWVEEETIELGTTEPGEEIYYFPVWLVVIDGDVYVRLGSSAAEKFEESTTKPYLGVKIAGQSFPEVEGISTPEKAEQVADLMGEKYWSDIFIRFVPHPLTLRLVPVSETPPSDG